MGDAFFASNAGELRGAISNVLSRTVPTTSRTQPAFSSGGTSGGGASRFFSGFEVGQLSLWRGHLERRAHHVHRRPHADEPERAGASAVLRSNLGDDFAYNVNNADPDYPALLHGRRADQRRRRPGRRDGAPRHHLRSGRRGRGHADELTRVSLRFASNVPAGGDGDPHGELPDGHHDRERCAHFFLEWLLGLNPTTDKNHRCKTRRARQDCSLFGDIYHSTPQIVGAPSALLRDESYERFAIDNQLRPIVLYTSTNDGFLHAFKVASNDPADTSAGLARPNGRQQRALVVRAARGAPEPARRSTRTTT